MSAAAARQRVQERAKIVCEAFDKLKADEKNKAIARLLETMTTAQMRETVSKL